MNLKKDLKRYYAKVLTCKKCGQIYGSDLTDAFEDNYCPKCKLFYQGKKSRWEKKNSTGEW